MLLGSVESDDDNDDDGGGGSGDGNTGSVTDRQQRLVMADANILSENLSIKDHLEDLGVDGEENSIWCLLRSSASGQVQ